MSEQQQQIQASLVHHILREPAKQSYIMEIFLEGKPRHCQVIPNEKTDLVNIFKGKTETLQHGAVPIPRL